MPKDTPFDPCKQWLGIDAVNLGNARLVLGVALEEADPAVVIRAADARLNLLRAISPGPFERARTSLITRVEEARDRLLAEIAAGPPRPPRPAAGGFAMPTPPAHLAASVPPPTSPPQAFAPVPNGPAVPPPVPVVGGVGGGAGAGDGFGEIRIRTTVYRKKTPVAGIALALVALAAAAGGLAYARFSKTPRRVVRLDPPARQVVPPQPEPSPVEVDPEQEERERERRREERERQRVEREEREREEKRKRALEELERQQRERESQERRQREGRANDRKKPEQNQDTRQPDADEQDPGDQAGQLDKTLAEVFAALQSPEGEPDHAGITKLLDEASLAARGGEAKKRLARWRDLVRFHEGFLGYRDQALAAVKAGDEYDIKDRKIAVVEVDDEIFKYQANGRKTSVPWSELPAGIMLAIVTAWFDEKPANDLFIGAYHFAKPEPNAKLAREHWEKAEAGGADASSLLPLLDDPVFTRATAAK